MHARNRVFASLEGSSDDEGGTGDVNANHDAPDDPRLYPSSLPINISPNHIMWPRDDDDDHHHQPLISRANNSAADESDPVLYPSGAPLTETVGLGAGDQQGTAGSDADNAGPAGPSSMDGAAGSTIGTSDSAAVKSAAAAAATTGSASTRTRYTVPRRSTRISANRSTSSSSSSNNNHSSNPPLHPGGIRGHRRTATGSSASSVSSRSDTASAASLSSSHASHTSHASQAGVLTDSLLVRSLKRSRVESDADASSSVAGSDNSAAASVAAPDSPGLDGGGDDGWGWFVDGSPSPASPRVLHLANLGRGGGGNHHVTRRAKTNSEDSSDSTNSRKVARTLRHGSSPSRNFSSARSASEAAANMTSSAAAATATTAGAYPKRGVMTAENTSPNASADDLRNLLVRSGATSNANAPPPLHRSGMTAGSSHSRGCSGAAAQPAVPSGKLSANNSLLDLWAANLRVDSSVNLAAVGASAAESNASAAAAAAAAATMESQAAGGGQSSGASAEAAAQERGEPPADSNFGAHSRVESFSFDFEM